MMRRRCLTSSIGEMPDRVDVAVRLVTRALNEIVPPGIPPPDYTRFVAPDWREHPATRRLIDDLTTIIGQTGGQFVAERFRFEWRPGTPIGVPAGRLTFRVSARRSRTAGLDDGSHGPNARRSQPARPETDDGPGRRRASSARRASVLTQRRASGGRSPAWPAASLSGS